MPDHPPAANAVTVACPHCGREHPVRKEVLGRLAKCTACAQRFVLRAGEEGVEPPPASPPAPHRPPASPPPFPVEFDATPDDSEDLRAQASVIQEVRLDSAVGKNPPPTPEPEPIQRPAAKGHQSKDGSLYSLASPHWVYWAPRAADTVFGVVQLLAFLGAFGVLIFAVGVAQDSPPVGFGIAIGGWIAIGLQVLVIRLGLEIALALVDCYLVLKRMLERMQQEYDERKACEKADEFLPNESAGENAHATN